MDVDVTVVLAAIINNEGGEYILPVSRYDELVGLTGHGIAFEIVDKEHVKLLIVKEEPDDIIIPGQQHGE